MSRPSEQEISEALKLVASGPASTSANAWDRALRTLRQALKPRTVWSSKEVAEALGVDPANLREGKMRDFHLLAEPFQTLPRPSKTNPDKVMRLFWADEVLEHPKAKELARRAKEGGA